MKFLYSNICHSGSVDTIVNKKPMHIVNVSESSIVLKICIIHVMLITFPINPKFVLTIYLQIKA